MAGLVEHFGLTAVLCDHKGNIQHTAGQVDRFLQFPVGAAHMAIAEVTVSTLRGELLNLLNRCHQTNSAQRSRRRKLDKQWLRIFVDPLNDAGNRLILILFVPEPATAEDDRVAEPAQLSTNHALEDELLSTREHLQALVEEMATANEEMQALNEEAQAANEELQATNEEMEAANEELQASNQELVSLNEELSVKTTELSKLTEEFAHLYDALQFPILVFDSALQLSRFNTPAARRFDLRPTAIRQHINRLRLPEGLSDIETALGRVLAHADREEKVVHLDGRDLRLAITPGLDKSGVVVTLVATLIDITEVALVQAKLLESQARLSALMEKTTVIFVMKDISGAYLFANQSFLNFFGVDQLDYVGKTDFALLAPNLAADLWGLDILALRQLGAPAQGEHVVIRNGGRHILRSVHQVILDGNGQPSGFITEAEDITTRKLAEEQLRITARVFDKAGEAIVVTDANSLIQTVNSAFTRITGYTAADAIGKSISLLKSGRHGPDFYKAMWQTMTVSGFWQGEIWNRRKDGEIYPEWLTISRVDDDRGQAEHYVAVFSDISSIKDSQHKAEYLSTHDPLTGLPNRALFHDRLRHAMAQARRQKARIALLFIDLDNFKTINDTLGHDVGDELLKKAAVRLRDVVRDVDSVARLGGDEFTAVLYDCNEETTNQVARRVVDDLSASFEISGRHLFVSASVGVSFYPEDGVDSSSLIKAADAAMYRAKEQGRNRVEFFKADMHVRLLKRAAMESALRESLRSDRLRLVYQPKFGLGAGHPLVGAEALLRWQDPELGAVSPAEFIPVAEASGLILELGNQVETMLLEQLVAWNRLGLNCPPIAFNVSPRSIREAEFAGQLLTKIADRQLPTHSVQIEITESALLDNSSIVAGNLAQLDQAGIRIAIDDFGTGYSSLSYLKRLPLTELKIDKSFVDGLGQDKEDEAIARAVLGLARALDFKAVAEGVETEQQLAWLVEHQCDIVQGYLLSRPLECPDFEDLIARQVQHG
jgi:two-component system CheB/CheR fusion protein